MDRLHLRRQGDHFSKDPIFFPDFTSRVPLFYLRLLQNRLHRLQGGLGVLNIARYYLAVQIAPLAMFQATMDIPLWVLLEIPYCAPVPASGLLWLMPKMHPTSVNLLMAHSLILWYSGRLMSPFLPLLPLLPNPMFPLGV